MEAHMTQPCELGVQACLPHTAQTHHGEVIELSILNTTLCSCSKDSTLFFVLLKPAFYFHASNHLALPISPWRAPTTGNNHHPWPIIHFVTTCGHSCKEPHTQSW